MKDLITLLPDHVAADIEVQYIQAALSAAMRKCWAARDSLIDQLMPQTATWALSMWETAYGIKSDTSQTDEQRREILIAQIRSAKTATAAQIMNVAAAWVNGEVEVIEYNGEYRFVINLISQYGIPDKMEDLQAAIDAIKPAHLAVSYTRRYLLIREVTPMTLAELAMTPLNYFAGGGKNVVSNT